MPIFEPILFINLQFFQRETSGFVKVCLSCSAIAAVVSLYMLYVKDKISRCLERNNIKRRYGCQDPPFTASKDPIFGLDSGYSMLRSFKEHRRDVSLKSQLDARGHTFQSNLFGKKEIFSDEPQNLQTVFSENFDNFGVQPTRLFPFEPLVGKGVMTLDGTHWRRSRSFLQPLFAKSQVTDLSSFRVHVEKLVDSIPRDGSTVDLQPMFAKLALDSSSQLLFGDTLGLLESDPPQASRAFWSSYRYAQRGIAKRLQLPKWDFLTRDPKFWDSCAAVRNHVGHYIDEVMSRSENAAPKVALINELLNVVPDKEYIKDQLLNVFIPAHDAIAVALTNVFFNLARHPDVWSKLREQVASINMENFSLEHLKGLNYLQAVIKETLRLHPTVGSVGRVALRDTILPAGGGLAGKSPVLIQKGDNFRTSFYSLHRRKDIYGDNAEQFIPDRWSDLARPPWSYLPFGGGPRVCPGQQLGLAQIMYTIVRIVQTFSDIENRDPVLEFVESYKLTTESRNGAKVGFVPVAS